MARRAGSASGVSASRSAVKTAAPAAVSSRHTPLVSHRERRVRAQLRRSASFGDDPVATTAAGANEKRKPRRRVRRERDGQAPAHQRVGHARRTAEPTGLHAGHRVGVDGDEEHEPGEGGTAGAYDGAQVRPEHRADLRAGLPPEAADGRGTTRTRVVAAGAGHRRGVRAVEYGQGEEREKQQQDDGDAGRPERRIPLVAVPDAGILRGLELQVVAPGTKIYKQGRAGVGHRLPGRAPRFCGGRPADRERHRGSSVPRSWGVSGRAERAGRIPLHATAPGIVRMTNHLLTLPFATPSIDVNPNGNQIPPRLTTRDLRTRT